MHMLSHSSLAYYTINMSGATVTLSMNSLYLCLTEISTPGHFHWSLFVTDNEGKASQHHWSEVVRPDGQYVEAYGYRWINPVYTVTGGQRLNVLFIRFSSWNFPSAPLQTVDAYLEGIFRGRSPIHVDGMPPSYNRNHNPFISCRTWALHALERLSTCGHLPIMDLAQFETSAIQAASYSVSINEQYLQSGQPFSSYMITL